MADLIQPKPSSGNILARATLTVYGSGAIEFKPSIENPNIDWQKVLKGLAEQMADNQLAALRSAIDMLMQQSGLTQRLQQIPEGLNKMLRTQ